jgi:hypothetical protein
MTGSRLSTKTHTAVSAVWFAALVVFFLMVESNLSVWSLAVLMFGGLGWGGFFLGPQVWRWISGSSPNVVIRNSARIFGVVMVLGWLLILWGFLALWMPYLKQIFAP